MKLILLLAGASCAFVSAGIAFRWSLFDLNDWSLNGDAPGYLGLAAMFLALAFAWEPLSELVKQIARAYR